MGHTCQCGQPFSRLASYKFGEELTVFFTRAEVETTFKREKEKASSTIACLVLKSLYLTGIAAKPYPLGYSVPMFSKFDGRHSNTREHVISFLDYKGPYDMMKIYFSFTNSRSL